MKQYKVNMNNNHVGDSVHRCDWSYKDALSVSYHDNEWGKPEYDSQKLFEMLCLGGQQAGLSWITILRKRNNYKKCFHDFDPHRVSKFTAEDVDRLQNEAGILRNKSKIEAIIHNSKCYIEMEKNGEDFSKFVWSVVNDKPVMNNWNKFKEAPAQTLESVALSKQLKQRGFKYVGPIICYAFMQTCGLVNDHIVSCNFKMKYVL